MQSGTQQQQQQQVGTQDLATTQTGATQQNQAGTTQQLGTNQQVQSGAQQAYTNPYDAAKPLLENLIAQYGGLNTGVTAPQSTALANLNAAASGIPNFGATGTDAVNKLFGTSTDPQIGMLSSALQQLQGNIGGTASGAELDPYKTPGFADAIGTMTDDITNRVKSVYAGSGRDPSGAGSFAKSLGRGLTEGISPIIASQFNTNNTNRLNAANRLFDAGGTTASGITGQQQVPLANSLQGLSSAGMLSSLFTQPATTQLGAANAAQATPFGNLAALLQPAIALGGVGGSTSGVTTGNVAGQTGLTGATTGTTAGTTTGTGTQTGATTGSTVGSGSTTGSATGSSTGNLVGNTAGTSNTRTEQQQSLMSQILGGASGAIGLLSFLSDERAKEEIEPVGKLDDGQQIYRYRYKGDPRMQIGLLAQEVERFEPSAVDELPRIGLLAVDYRKATDRAAQMRKAA